MISHMISFGHYLEFLRRGLSLWHLLSRIQPLRRMSGDYLECRACVPLVHPQLFSTPPSPSHHWHNEKDESDWWASDSSMMLLYWLHWPRLTAHFTAKKAHAPDCMPPLMGKPFSAECCGKAVHFLFSHRVVNSTFSGGRSVSLLKGFVMPFLQGGFTRQTDACDREGCLVFVETIIEVADNRAGKTVDFSVQGNLNLKPPWSNGQIRNQKQIK